MIIAYLAFQPALRLLVSKGSLQDLFPTDDFAEITQPEDNQIGTEMTRNFADPTLKQAGEAVL